MVEVLQCLYVINMTSSLINCWGLDDYALVEVIDDWFI